MLGVVIDVKLPFCLSGIRSALCNKRWCCSLDFSDGGAELIVDSFELKSLNPICFLVWRRVLIREGGASTTKASTTVDVVERPDIVENLLVSDDAGDSALPFRTLGHVPLFDIGSTLSFSSQ